MGGLANCTGTEKVDEWYPGATPPRSAFCSFGVLVGAAFRTLNCGNKCRANQ
ncbi:unnamed protein product [Amoebophrya sp. A25]|nr:unnamed protein product [Amoebophrya sp. A25]|eukprot:GSA25T00026187001.1